jgi:hypothetical protein
LLTRTIAFACCSARGVRQDVSLVEL